MNEQQPAPIPVFVDEDDERELMAEIAQELADEIKEGVLEAFPLDAVPYRVWRGATAHADISLIMDRDYLTKLRGGWPMPMPMSPLWFFLAQIPWLWDKVASAFREGYRRSFREAGL